MLSGEAKETLKEIVTGNLLFDEPMENHTSFHVGGPAEVLIVPKDESDLIRAINFANENSIRMTIIGAGTKLLVSDDGLSGIVIKMSSCLSDLRIFGCEVEAGAGLIMSNLSRSVGEQGLSGLEFAVGIPGTVGGGVIMNAGAHKSSLSDVVKSVKAITLEGEEREFTKDELGFDYRKSILQGSSMIVISAKLALRSGSVEEISESLAYMTKDVVAYEILDIKDLPQEGAEGPSYRMGGI